MTTNESSEPKQKPLGKWQIVLIAVLVLILIGSLSSCGSEQSNPDTNSGVVSDQSEQFVESNLAELSYVSSIPFNSTVLQFPTKLSNYRILEDSIRGKNRIFSDDRFVENFPELVGYSGFSAGANACSAYYWMIRWRSQNEDVEVAVGTSSNPDSDGIDWDTGSPSAGGAGFMSGFSCTTPFMYFAKAINGNQANLVDVNYEVLIWEYYQDI
jgi:hypothetical protein